MENQAPPPPAGIPSVHLGIGSLIIIALIVTMCSGKGEVRKIRKDTAELKEQIGELNRKLDTLIQKEAATPGADVEAPAASDTGASPAQK